MYLFCIVDVNKKIMFSRVFRYQADIIRFTNRKVTYNDFKKRSQPKKYKTYKDFFFIRRI